MADPAPTDPAHQRALEALQAELGDRVVGTHAVPGAEVCVRVAPEAWAAAGLLARERLRCSYFCFLSAIDWMPSPFGRSEDDSSGPQATPAGAAEIVTGVAGGGSRFQVFARVVSPERRFGIFLKTDVPDDDFAVDTWIGTYAGANWHERETHEMFGIGFRGHPHLTHIYLPGGFEGHPLRKDFPLLARQVKPWPGVVDVEPMPDDGTDSAEGTDASGEGGP